MAKLNFQHEYSHSKFKFGAQERILIIMNVKKSFCCFIFLWKLWCCFSCILWWI